MASGPGRPLGLPVPGFTPPPSPGSDRIEGRFVALERLGPAQHAEALFHANRGRDDLWDYMGYGPFGTQGEYRAWPDSVAESRDPFFHALRERSSGRVAGVAAFLRIEPAHGVLEIGHVHTAPLRPAHGGRDPGDHADDRLGFRRGLSLGRMEARRPERALMRAAGRCGFAYEGTFRSHMIVKSCNRDTAWHAITDADWPSVKAAQRMRLSPENLDNAGRRRRDLQAIRGGLA